LSRFELVPDEVWAHSKLASFSKWFFDFTKNIIVVAALKALAERSGSVVLNVAFWLSLGALTGPYTTWIYRWRYVHSSPVKRPKLYLIFYIVIFMVIFMAAFYLITIGSAILVDAITKAQAH
jgi:hypothetical protein